MNKIKECIFDIDNIQKIFNKAVKNAIEENKRLNIPSVFFIDDEPVYKMPNGELKTEFDWSLLKIKK